MRLIVQRVSSASVSLVDTGEVVGKVNKGLFVLLGIKKGDSRELAEYFAQKLSHLRIMADAKGKMNLPAQEFLVVSQFTLISDTKSGNRPSFINAEMPKVARNVYDHFVNSLHKLAPKVETGKFGEYMKIDLELEGPVTIILENSKKVL